MKPPETKPDRTNHTKALDRNLWRKPRPIQGCSTSGGGGGGGGGGSGSSNNSSEVMFRPTVSRSACLGVMHPSGAHDQICITVQQLRVY
jgi:hypothetical protein